MRPYHILVRYHVYPTCDLWRSQQHGYLSASRTYGWCEIVSILLFISYTICTEVNRYYSILICVALPLSKITMQVQWTRALVGGIKPHVQIRYNMYNEATMSYNASAMPYPYLKNHTIPQPACNLRTSPTITWSTRKINHAEDKNVLLASKKITRPSSTAIAVSQRSVRRGRLMHYMKF